MSLTGSTTELSSRLAFAGIDDQSCESIRAFAHIVDRELPRALDKFYAKLRTTPEVQRFFESEAQITRAKSAQIGHWSSIRDAKFDSTYMAKVRVIGLTHARIGLEPRWYIGGYALIVEHLLDAILTEALGKSGGWLSKKHDVSQVVAAVGALVKAVLLDMDLAISVYLEAAEEARLQGEAKAKAEERQLVASSIGSGLDKLAQKDLTFRISGELPEAY